VFCERNGRRPGIKSRRDSTLERTTAARSPGGIAVCMLVESREEDRVRLAYEALEMSST